MLGNIRIQLERMVVLLICLCVVAETLHADDHGDSFQSASSVGVGQIVSGSLEVSGDRDYFRFSVTQQATYFLFTPGNTDTTGELYDSSLQRLASNGSDGELRNFRIERLLVPGTYYVAISGFLSTATGSYQFHIEGPGAGTVSDDNGSSPWSARSATLGSVTAGILDVEGDRDYFKFSVSQQANYYVFSRGSADTDGALFDSNLQQLASNGSDGELRNFRIERLLLPGTYYLMVRGFLSSTTGAYQLHIEGPGAGTVSDDHGFSPWSATAVAIGNSTSGSLNVERDRDYFKFSVTQQATYFFFTRGSTDTTGELYDSSLQQVATNGSDGELRNFRIEKVLAPGTYYVAVLGFLSATGGYQFHIEGPGAGTVSDDHGFSPWSATTVSIGRSPQRRGVYRQRLVVWTPAKQ